MGLISRLYLFWDARSWPDKVHRRCRGILHEQYFGDGASVLSLENQAMDTGYGEVDLD